VSAAIIRFLPRPRHIREPTGFPAIAFRSTARPDHLVMDHADTAPCEYVWPDQCDPASELREEPAAAD
jgi:hypothetical protein